MYKIERRTSGYILTFSGLIDPDEMQRWSDESERILSTEKSSSFGVIINMKDLQALSSESQALMVNGQKKYKAKGMKRSAVILNNEKICSQFKNLAIQSGIYSTERYIDSSNNSDPINTAINWVKDALDPDL
ncbi:MAG: hypothetical protein GQ564_18915 [Bacteroidales bacterium]|nr:hypothetical protein [Bacteroidales bacterium]